MTIRYKPRLDTSSYRSNGSSMWNASRERLKSAFHRSCGILTVRFFIFSPIPLLPKENDVFMLCCKRFDVLIRIELDKFWFAKLENDLAFEASLCSTRFDVLIGIGADEEEEDVGTGLHWSFVELSILRPFRSFILNPCMKRHEPSPFPQRPLSQKEQVCPSTSWLNWQSVDLRGLDGITIDEDYSIDWGDG